MPPRGRTHQERGQDDFLMRNAPNMEEFDAGYDKKDLDELGMEVGVKKTEGDLGKLAETITVLPEPISPIPEKNDKDKGGDKGKDKPNEKKEQVDGFVDVFGDLDTQNHYLAGVKRAMSDPGFGDRLHKFLMDHPTDRKGGFVKTNGDWRKLLGFTPSKEFQAKNRYRTNIRLAAATQLNLNELLGRPIFDVQNEGNSRTRVDGKLGVYSLIGLGELWNYAFSPKSNLPKIRIARHKGENSLKGKASEDLDNAHTRIYNERYNYELDETDYDNSEEVLPEV